MDIYASICVLRRMDAVAGDSHVTEQERRRHLQTGRYFLSLARRRIQQNFAALRDNDDDATVALANL